MMASVVYVVLLVSNSISTPVVFDNDEEFQQSFDTIQEILYEKNAIELAQDSEIMVVHDCAKDLIFTCAEVERLPETTVIKKRKRRMYSKCRRAFYLAQNYFSIGG